MWQTVFMRRYLLFLPSTLTGLVAVVWLYFRPFPYEAKFGFGVNVLLGVLLALGFFSLAYLLEKALPSFRNASRLLERVLSAFEMTLPLALLLALLSAVSEELFFRAALMPLIGVWGQAVLFGLMHPAPRRAWSYTVFTFFAGLAFGYVTLLSGSLWPALLAHFSVNFHGFLALKRLQDKRKQQRTPQISQGLEASE